MVGNAGGAATGQALNPLPGPDRVRRLAAKKGKALWPTRIVSASALCGTTQASPSATAAWDGARSPTSREQTCYAGRLRDVQPADQPDQQPEAARSFASWSDRCSADPFAPRPFHLLGAVSRRDYLDRQGGARLTAAGALGRPAWAGPIGARTGWLDAVEASESQRDADPRGDAAKNGSSC